MDKTVWYELQVSRKDADDFDNTNITADTPKEARVKLRAQRKRPAQHMFDWRIVRKTLVEEVWPDRHVQPVAGLCPECLHYGGDCRGAKE
jgi:hypothetical protein